MEVLNMPGQKMTIEQLAGVVQNIFVRLLEKGILSHNEAIDILSSQGIKFTIERS